MKDVLRPVVVGRFSCCFSDSNRVSRYGMVWGVGEFEGLNL